METPNNNSGNIESGNPKKFKIPDIYNENDEINVRSVLFKRYHWDMDLINYERCKHIYDTIDLKPDVYKFSRGFKQALINVIYGDESNILDDSSEDKFVIFTIPIVDVNYESMLINYVFDEYFNNKINIVNTNLVTYNDISNSVFPVSFNIQDTTIEYFTITFSNFHTKFILCNLKYALLKESLDRFFSNDSIVNNNASSLLKSLYMHKMKDYISEGFDQITEKFALNQFTQTAVMISTDGKFKAETGLYCMSNSMFTSICNDVAYVIRNMFKDAKDIDSFFEAYDEFYESIPIFEFDLDEETTYLIKGDIYD